MIEKILKEIEQTEKGLKNITQGESLLWSGEKTDLYRYMGKIIKFYYFKNKDTSISFIKDFYQEYLKYINMEEIT